MNGYSYTYDKANRLTSAIFGYGTVSSGDNFNFTFTNKYNESSINYDHNGNLTSLSRYHGNFTIVDSLQYSAYNGNILGTVKDVSGSTSTVGFQDRNNGSKNDYQYDANGNLTFDYNKNITAITYNYLNLPTLVTIEGKGTIAYTYDAAGNKLQRTLTDQTVTPNKVTNYYYAGNFLYRNDTLEFINLPEGRLRPVRIDTTKAISIANLKYIYDYYLKDHLGSVRTVITTDQETDIYTATMEAANATTENLLFANISSTTVAKPTTPSPGFDSDNTNAQVSQLNGNVNVVGNKRVGPSIVLKVMAGDTVSISIYAWYAGATQSPATGVPPIANDILPLLRGGVISDNGTKGGTIPSSGINTLLSAVLNTFLSTTKNSNYNNTRPKAFLNWMIVDEEFNAVSSPNHLGAVQIPLISGSMQKQQLVGPTKMVVRRNGWLYVYVSNESNQNVFFDNMSLNQTRGPVLEVNDFYQFGLQIPGSSSEALKANYSQNRYKYNGIEYDTAFGLDYNEAEYRDLDPQIGRWTQIDPKPNMGESPYASMGNNPVLQGDPLGDTLPPNLEAMLLPPRNKDGDQTGLIRNATQEEYGENPWGALGKDFVHLVPEITGLNTVDDEGANIHQKIDNSNLTAGDVTASIVNIALASSTSEEGVEPIELHIDPNVHPEAAAHVENAMKNGVSGEGVIDRAGKNSRRANNLAGVPTQKDMDRDEFPPAVINNGGNGQSVLHINPSDNRGAGASLGNQIKNLPDNTRVIIIISKLKNQ